MIARHSGRAIIFDGVVKSPIYCVGSVFQVLSILTCIDSSPKNHYALYIELFTLPSGAYSKTFYEFIKVNSRFY